MHNVLIIRDIDNLMLDTSRVIDTRNDNIFSNY